MREGEDFLKTYPVTAVLFLINAVMFLLTEFAGRPGSTDTMLRLGAAYTPYIRDGQYWRLITSCILTYAAELLSGEQSVSAGASGAIFGLIGIYAVILLKNRSRLGRDMVLRVVFGVTLAVLPGFYNKGISLTAHLGGLLAGIVMGLLTRSKCV